MHGGLDAAYFVHHLLVHGQTAGRIDDNHLTGVFFGVVHRMFGNFDRVFLVRLAIYLHAYLRAQGFELVDGRRPIDVASRQQHLFAFLLFEIQGQLGRVGGFTGALQTRHENDGGGNFEVEFDGLAPHEGGHLVVHQLNHHLPRRHGSKHVHAQGFFFDGVGKLLGYLETDVGIQQSPAHLFERLGHIDFGNSALPFKDLEGPI